MSRVRTGLTPDAWRDDGPAIGRRKASSIAGWLLAPTLPTQPSDEARREANAAAAKRYRDGKRP